MATRALQDGRVIGLVWLEIDDAVVAWGQTRFSSTNAVSNAACIDAEPATALDSDDPQAEVLVLRSLRTQWIRFPGRAEVAAAHGSPLSLIWTDIRAFFDT